MINIDSTFGQTFRTERERQGIDLETVSEATKIRKHYLKALEDDNFSILPPRVYATGFVASYARFLSMDPEVMVSQFKILAYPAESVPEPEHIKKKTPENNNRREKDIFSQGQPRIVNLPLKNMVIAALFLVTVIWAGSQITDYIASRGSEQPPTVQEPAKVQTPAKETQEPEKLVLKIAARQKCWVEIKVDGAENYAGIIDAGDSKSFEASATFDVKAGNAGGIDLYLNNQPLQSLGGVGQVVEKQIDKNGISKE